jgi:outer membrane protein assembly factor BamB
MTRRTALVVAVVVLMGSCEWNHYRAGPGRSGYNPLENTISRGNVASLVAAWSQSAGPAGDRSPVVAGGKVFVGASGTGGGSPAVLYAKDAASGAHRWSQSYATTSPDFPPSLTVAAVGDTVYAGRLYGTDLGALYAYNAANGAPRWTSPFGTALWPEVANGKVYARYARFDPGLVSGFAAWDVATGDVLFRSVEPLGSGGTAVRGGTVFLAQGTQLEAYDAAGVTNCSGGPPKVCTPLWTGSLTGAAVYGTPAVADGVVYVNTDSDLLHAFPVGGCGTTTCAPLWTASTVSTPGSPAVANGRVYVGGADGKLRVFDASGCATSPCAALWSGTTGGPIYSSPGVANGVVYVGSDDTKLYAFAAADCGSATCSPLWSAVPDGGAVRSSPAIAAGRVFITGSSMLVAYALPSS